MALTSKPILTLTVNAGETLTVGDPVGVSGTKTGAFFGVCQEDLVQPGWDTAVACKGALIGKSGGAIAAGDEVVVTGGAFETSTGTNGTVVGVALTGTSAAGQLFEFVA